MAVVARIPVYYSVVVLPIFDFSRWSETAVRKKRATPQTPCQVRTAQGPGLDRKSPHHCTLPLVLVPDPIPLPSSLLARQLPRRCCRPFISYLYLGASLVCTVLFRGTRGTEPKGSSKQPPLTSVFFSSPEPHFQVHFAPLDHFKNSSISVLDTNHS